MSKPKYDRLHTHNITIKGIKYYIKHNKVNKNKTINICSKCDGERVNTECIISQLGLICNNVIGKNCYLKKMAKQRVRHHKSKENET